MITTDVGTELLRLLTDCPDQWEFAPGCDGMRHTPTGVLLAPLGRGAAGRVYLSMPGNDDDPVAVTALTDDDHARLSAVLAPLIAAHKAAQAAGQLAALRALLKLR